MWVALSIAVWSSGIVIIKGIEDYNTIKNGEEPNWTENGDDIQMLCFWPVILVGLLLGGAAYLLFSTCSKYAKNILGWPSKTITNKLLKHHGQKLLPPAKVKR